MTIGSVDYRRAGLERLNDSGILLRQESYAGGIYLAGRAVECMLRAVIWSIDDEIRAGRRSLDAGHDLRELLTLVANLGVLPKDAHRNRLAADVNYVGRLWFNNMRFLPTEKLKTLWWELKVVRGKQTLKQAAWRYYDVCSTIVKRCEALCQS